MSIRSLLSRSLLGISLILVCTMFGWKPGSAGDGVLPLRLIGDLRTLSPESTVSKLSLQFSRIGEFDLGDQAKFHCQTNRRSVRKLQAGGSLVLDGSSFAITGVCHQPISKAVEVLATVGQDAPVRVSLDGRILSVAENKAVFKGRVSKESSDSPGVREDVGVFELSQPATDQLLLDLQ